ncbi:hypothetical protein PV327_008233 [Microctonus hyperodae]|uniref:BHLH domain-containing protein n=1 Tax=Microctonus hyperodae TaxID=165561 RepID=A0AA39F2Q4_MICHY|nr:hypothetical protein PV327_008233 [Microctonus hyperodae]
MVIRRRYKFECSYKQLPYDEVMENKFLKIYCGVLRKEEIDVVSFEKPCRPVVLPTHPNPVDHQNFQMTVNTALKEKPAPRPRGRPPSNPNRKRAAQEIQKPAKRVATQRTCQRKTKATKNTPAVQQQSSVSGLAVAPTFNKSIASVKTCFDEEPDNDKRNLHNNMERQRRIELRHAFDDLRRLVPEIEAKEKAPKVAILQQAAEYCERLKRTYDENVLIEAAELKRQKKRLARIHLLRVTLANMRREKSFAENSRNYGITN